jgi:hypothetical protein
MATELIKVSELPVKTTDFGDGDLLIVSEYNGGTYVSKSKNAFKLGLDAAAYDPAALWNVGLAASVSGNALTIALKQKNGTTDPASDKGRVRIGFRSSTVTDGASTSVDAVAATNTVISSGSTAGFKSASEGIIYVYAINNAGAIELAWSSGAYFNESKLQSTTAEGGAGAADGLGILYSTTARSNVAIRLIGYLLLTEATAGTWATGPSVVFAGNLKTIPNIPVPYTPGSQGFGTITSVEVVFFQNGPRLDVEGRFAAGTPTASEARINLPVAAWTPRVVSSNFAIGNWIRSNGSANTNKRGNIMSFASANYINFSLDDYVPAINPSSPQNGSVFAGVGDVICFKFSVYINQW